MRHGIFPHGFSLRSVSLSSSGLAGLTVTRPVNPKASIAMRTLRPNGDVTVDRSTKFSVEAIFKSPADLLFSVHAGIGDDLCPLLGLAVDVVAEMFGRIADQYRALARQLLDDGRILHRLN